VFDRFDDITPNELVDYVGNNNGVFYGDPTWVEHVYGCIDEFACNYNVDANTNDGSCEYSCHNNGNYSLSLDGENDYVEINNISYSNDFTVSGIFKTTIDTDGSSMSIFDQDGGDGQDLLVVSVRSNRLNVGFRNESAPGTDLMTDTIVDDGNIHSFSVVREGDSLKLYLDGSLEGSTSVPSFEFNNDKPTFIGVNNFSGSPSNYFSGFITKIKLINIAVDPGLDDSWISDEIDNNTIALWNFNQGNSGEFPDILIDYSGNQNHGIINGAEWSGCTDELACNYDPDAADDDGTCFYKTECFDGSYECDADDCLYVEVISPISHTSPPFGEITSTYKQSSASHSYDPSKHSVL
jgi:hypothetical protein